MNFLFNQYHYGSLLTLLIIMIKTAAKRCSGSKKSSYFPGNDCHLLKVKRKNSIIATSLNDRAHTMFVKTMITLSRKTQKKKAFPELRKYKSE